MKAKLATDNTLMFWCPGCEEHHGITVNSPHGWTWNQSLEEPTVSPSILVNGTRALVDGKPVHWFKYEGEYPAERCDFICHSFVKDGQIQFLGDCSHDLKGQTVPLPDIDKVAEFP